MTIIGMHIASRDRALLWCDSECYRYGKPIGHTPKMAISNLAHAVVVGAGSVWTNAIAAEVLSDAASLDQIVAGLRDAHNRTKSREATMIVVGWSHEMSRLVGFVFRGSRLYEPFMTNGYELPAIGDHSAPAEVEDVFPIANLQMAEIRKDMPEAGAGQLTVIEITRQAITVRPALDLGRHEMLSGPMRFAAVPVEQPSTVAT